MSLTDLLPEVRAALDRLVRLSEPAWQSFAAKLRLRSLSDGEYFLRAGQPAEQIAFVASGVVREYFITAQGSEYNKAFVLPGSFSGSLYDLLMGGFWNVSDPIQHHVQMAHFIKNVSMIGGALIILHFGSGPLSLWP
ncbi:MAG: hypothetical protein K1X75_16825 [Leptospirales bacterium]|nr:hypothetical protein [Leptospirales bacterium]